MRWAEIARARSLAELLLSFSLADGRLGSVLEASWGRLGGVLEASWASWPRLGSILESSWGRLGGLLGVLAASWKRLGGVLGVSWRPLGGKDREMARKAQLNPQKPHFYLDSVTSTLKEDRITRGGSARS